MASNSVTERENQNGLSFEAYLSSTIRSNLTSVLETEYGIKPTSLNFERNEEEITLTRYIELLRLASKETTTYIIDPVPVLLQNWSLIPLSQQAILSSPTIYVNSRVISQAMMTTTSSSPMLHLQAAGNELLVLAIDRVEYSGDQEINQVYASYLQLQPAESAATHPSSQQLEKIYAEYLPHHPPGHSLTNLIVSLFDTPLRPHLMNYKALSEVSFPIQAAWETCLRQKPWKYLTNLMILYPTLMSNAQEESLVSCSGQQLCLLQIRYEAALQEWLAYLLYIDHRSASATMDEPNHFRRHSSLYSLVLVDHGWEEEEVAVARQRQIQQQQPLEEVQLQQIQEAAEQLDHTSNQTAAMTTAVTTTASEEEAAEEQPQVEVQEPIVTIEQKAVASLRRGSLNIPAITDLALIEALENIDFDSLPSNKKNNDMMKLSIVQRQALKKRKQELVKQQKMAAFLDNSSSQDQGQGQIESATTAVKSSHLPVKERFAEIKKQQQLQEEARLLAFRNDPRKAVNYDPSNTGSNNSTVAGTASASSNTGSNNSTVAGTASASSSLHDIREVYNNNISSSNKLLSSSSMDQQQAPPSSPQQQQQRTGKRHMWEAVLSSSKTTEKDRFQATKQSTIAQFRITQGTGIVKRRIDEWEELFVQIVASQEQLDAFLKAAYLKAQHAASSAVGNNKQSLLEQRAQFLQSCLYPEDFIIEDTHIYSLKLFEPAIQAYLQSQILSLAGAMKRTSNTTYCALQCGVYGAAASNGNEAADADTATSAEILRPRIDVFAAVMKTADGKIYVAITVKKAAKVPPTPVPSAAASTSVADSEVLPPPPSSSSSSAASSPRLANKTTASNNSSHNRLDRSNSLTSSTDKQQDEEDDDDDADVYGVKKIVLFGGQDLQTKVLEKLIHVLPIGTILPTFSSSRSQSERNLTATGAVGRLDSDSYSMFDHQQHSNSGIEINSTGRRWSRKERGEGGSGSFDDEEDQERLAVEVEVEVEVDQQVEETGDDDEAAEIAADSSQPQEPSGSSSMKAMGSSKRSMNVRFSLAGTSDGQPVETGQLEETDTNAATPRQPQGHTASNISAAWLLSPPSATSTDNTEDEGDGTWQETITPAMGSRDDADKGEKEVMPGQALAYDDDEEQEDGQEQQAVAGTVTIITPPRHDARLLKQAAGSYHHDDAEQDQGEEEDDEHSHEEETAASTKSGGSSAKTTTSAAALTEAETEALMEKDDDRPVHFGAELFLPNVSIPRTYLPNNIPLLDDSSSSGAAQTAGNGSGGLSPLRRSMNRHAGITFSWQMEDERSEDLPRASHHVLSMNLRDISAMTCSANLWALQTSSSSGSNGSGSSPGAVLGGGGGGSTILFTGTLKRASTPTRYVVAGPVYLSHSTSSQDSSSHQEEVQDESWIFEWIRGAACSGWLLKWPMLSQKLGRRTWRFFVLRDHLLSYHDLRPESEEDILNYYARNTLHLTEATTVEASRKFLQKCLVITTPLDTLWIRVRRDFEMEAAKWMSEMNKAIQMQKRPKLFMSKPRIESKWYHESTQFGILAVDVMTYAATPSSSSSNQQQQQQQHSGDGQQQNGSLITSPGSLSITTSGNHGYSNLYVKAALFCYREEITVPIVVFNTNNNSSTGTTRSRLSGLFGGVGAGGGGANSNSSGLGKGEKYTYSVDIATSVAGRQQLELLHAENESDVLPSHLSLLKVYGDVILVGGNQGYVGIGILARTKGGDNTLVEQLLAEEREKGGIAASTEDDSSSVQQPTRRGSSLLLGSSPPPVATRRGSLQASGDRRGSLQGGSLQPPAPLLSSPLGHMAARAHTSTGSAASNAASNAAAGSGNSSSATSKSSRKAILCYPLWSYGPAANASASSSNSSGSSIGSSYSRHGSYPHNFQAHITAIGVAQGSVQPSSSSSSSQPVFAVADSQGKLSLWTMPRNRLACAVNHPGGGSGSSSSSSSSSMILPNNLLASHMKKMKPTMLDQVDLKLLMTSSTGSSMSYSNEKVMKLIFAANDHYLFVCTNRRLLLITLQWSAAAAAAVNTAAPATASAASSMLLLPEYYTAVCSIEGFQDWIELDRALPGLQAVFDVVMLAPTPIIAPAGKTTSSSQGEEEEDDYQQEDEIPRDSSNLALERCLLEWRIVEYEEDEISKARLQQYMNNNANNQGAGIELERKCTASRLEWSKEMFLAALQRLRPVVHAS